MKARFALLAGIGIGMLTAWTPTPAGLANVSAASAAQHEQHQPGSTGAPAASTAAENGNEHRNMMMANMMAADAKIDALVKTMNEATGTAKVDAVAAVLNALVEQHRTMHGMMAGHVGMMGGMMKKPAGSPGAAQAPPEK